MALNQCWRLLASFLPSPRASDDEDNIELDDAADADFGSPGLNVATGSAISLRSHSCLAL